jgi:3',5'-cyclic-AMP phosphodiesterase
MESRIVHDHNGDGIDRRGFLTCMAWVGTGLLWAVGNGVPSSRVLAQTIGGKPAADPLPKGAFTFVQISDSHIGFAKEPNTDVTATLREAIARVNALPEPPAFILHTGDLTHLSKPEEFDTVAQVLKTAKAERTFFVPGEHDFFADEGKRYLERYGAGTRGTGWHSFDVRGTHFVGLVNVANLKPGGLGLLGADQLEWLKKDLAPLSSSTPVVVFAHVPLWTVYEKWGWGTEDSEAALSLVKRFGSVTVLNGHVHQTLQKVEGNVTFHTARSTAFPQPAPGAADSPGPMKNVPAGKLRSLLGIASVGVVEGSRALPIVDATLD